MDPRVAGELSLRIPHLGLRMREHSSRAQYYAERLEALGARVCYPGLPSHPQYRLLRQLANPGEHLLAEARTRLPAPAKSWRGTHEVVSRLPACSSCTARPPHHLLAGWCAGYGAGGMLTLELGSLAQAKCFMERLQNKHSFGGWLGGWRREGQGG